MESPMSGSQSTLTDRTPNILNKDPTDKKPKHEKSSVSLKHEFDPTGLVQRCVIIQRDENGFGLTVSGDNPVFVQLVKEDGAAMRAGVQTGDRIIKVNGTLVTHSNHIEVVKLIKSGSYVALTVLGRPPYIPLEEDEDEEEKKEEGAEVSSPLTLSVQHSPALPAGERCSHETSRASCSPQESTTTSLPDGAESKTMPGQMADMLQKMLMKEHQDLQAKEEEYSRNSRPNLLKEIQEVKKHISLLQEQLSKVKPQHGEAEEGDSGLLVREPSPWGDGGSDGPSSNNNSMYSSLLPESPGKRETPCQSVDINSCPSPDTELTPEADVSAQCIVGSPPYLLNPQIIGAEDEYFDYQQEQINGECSSFQSVDLLKSRPAHLAVFLHHVISQFDPAPLLCYLYADMHKQTSSKESRRFFMEFHTLFLDRSANLKVPLPETVAAELEKRRLELIPEELCRQYTQVLQDTLLPDLHKNLEDFRQKRSMGLTLAEEELSKLDTEQGKDAFEKECSCAEHILSKIEDILSTSQPVEEDKCQTMQYVILTYMKHLGVKVKEPRGLEHKRARINFLPKIKKSIKPEKEGEEKVKKPRFPNILGPPRRLSRVDSTSVGKAVELNKPRSPKPLSQPTFAIPEQSDCSTPNHGRVRGNQLSEGSDTSLQSLPPTTSPTLSPPTSQASDTSGQDSDSNASPFCIQPRPSEGPQSGDHQDGVCSPTNTQFDFSPSNLEQLQEEDQDTFSRMEVQCAPSSADIQSEDDQGGEMESEENPLNWQSLVSPSVLASLKPQEIKRQEVINELFYTERAHLRTLKVLDSVFYQRLNRDSILPPEDIRHIFINLEEIIQLHVSITEQMTVIRKRSETSVIGQIADDLLTWFSGEEEEKIKRAVGTYCSNQPSALELIKSKKKKDQRFYLFMQEAERNRLCRRLQLKDIIPVEMQRVTKYPLLLDNIAKYTEDGEEREKVKKAGECCKKILNHVNQAVKEAENKQRLIEYQRRLDISSLKQSENPMILELKNLDLTKRKMVHEGPLLWKVNRDKTIELYTILLEDILVLLQKQDERLVLKFHGKNVASVADSKHTFSPIVKLNTVLVRPVATDNRSLFVLSMSENGAQIYELMAQTVTDQRLWQCLITQCAEAMKAKPRSNGAPAAQTDADVDAADIIKHEGPKTNKDANSTSAGSISSSEKDAASSPDVGAPPSMNPFDGLKSEDEEEDQEVDEAELEAFLDGQLEDSLQDGSSQTAENQEPGTFGIPSSKGEEALRTLAMLKQVLFNHMLSREVEEGGPRCPPGSPEGPSAAAPDLFPDPQKDSQPPTGQAGLTEAPERNGGFTDLDFAGGVEESSTDDDGGGFVCIDMRKLLSSSSQTGGSAGPDLSRQLMTHLRLLQADLQYLKEVEMKYNELRQTHSDQAAADSDDNNDGIQ